jgi:hypothetical protein
MRDHRVQRYNFDEEKKILLEAIKLHAKSGHELRRKYGTIYERVYDDWLQKGDELVRSLDPIGGEYDIKTSWDQWHHARKYFQGNYPKNPYEKLSVFDNSIKALENIYYSPIISITKTIFALDQDNILKFESDVCFKINRIDKELFSSGKSLRGKLLQLRALNDTARLGKDELVGDSVNRLVESTKPEVLKIFKLCLESSLLETILYKYPLSDHIIIGALGEDSFTPLEIEILKIAGLSDIDIIDFLAFIRKECSGELSKIYEIGLIGLKNNLYEIANDDRGNNEEINNTNTNIFKRINGWTELVGGFSITAWNLALFSTMTLAMPEYIQFYVKLVAALALAGSGINKLANNPSSSDSNQKR